MACWTFSNEQAANIYSYSGGYPFFSFFFVALTKTLWQKQLKGEDLFYIKIHAIVFHAGQVTEAGARICNASASKKERAMNAW